MNELWEKIEAILEIACNFVIFACNPLGEILTCHHPREKLWGVLGSQPRGAPTQLNITHSCETDG